jgi:superfamily II DNA or RNA helicase
MPTGSGKTFVGAELIRHSLALFPDKKALFLVPTIDLVEQQASALEKWMNDGKAVAR